LKDTSVIGRQGQQGWMMTGGGKSPGQVLDYPRGRLPGSGKKDYF
jgi:hypothetical protein